MKINPLQTLKAILKSPNSLFYKGKTAESSKILIAIKINKIFNTFALFFILVIHNLLLLFELIFLEYRLEKQNQTLSKSSKAIRTIYSM